MKLKSIVLTLFILLFCFSFLNADTKEGKFLGAKDVTMPSWFMSSFLDLREDINELSANNKRLIVFIHQPNCPYCHRFVTKNLEDQATKQKILKNFAVVDINMFGDKEVTDVDGNVYSEKEFATKYNVQFTPTLLFFDEKADQILRLNGYMNIEKFNVALDYVSTKQEGKIAYKEYLVQKMALQSKASLIEEPDLFTDTSNFVRKKGSGEFALFFESANCKACETLHNKLLKDKLSRELLKKIDLYQVDLDSDKSIVTPSKMIIKIKDWADELAITNSPTIIFFNESGDEIIRIEAMFKTFHFQSLVDYVVSGAYKEEKEFQRYLTQRANKIRAKGKDVNIWD